MITPPDSIIKLYGALGVEELCSVLGWHYLGGPNWQVSIPSNNYKTLADLHDALRKYKVPVDVDLEFRAGRNGKLHWEEAFKSYQREDLPYPIALDRSTTWDWPRNS